MLVALTLVSVTGGILAEQQRNRANDQARIATARGAAANAVAGAPQRLDRSLLLGAQAVSMYDSPTTMFGLLTGLGAARHLVGFQREFGVGTDGLDVTPDGSLVVTVTTDGRWTVRSTSDWSVTNSTQVKGLGKTNYVEILGDGRLILVLGAEGGRLFDAKTLQSKSPRLEDPRGRADSPLQLVDVAQSGDRYAVSSLKGDRITVPRMSDGMQIATIKRPCDFTGVGPFDLSADGRRLYVTCEFAPLVVFDAITWLRVLVWNSLCFLALVAVFTTAAILGARPLD